MFLKRTAKFVSKCFNEGAKKWLNLWVTGLQGTRPKALPLVFVLSIKNSPLANARGRNSPTWDRCKLSVRTLEIPRKASAVLQTVRNDQEKRTEEIGEQFAAGSAKGSPCWRPLAALETTPSQRCSSVWLFWFSLNGAVSPSCGLLQLKIRALVEGWCLLLASWKLEYHSGAFSVPALQKCCVDGLDWDSGSRDRLVWRHDWVRTGLLCAHWPWMDWSLYARIHFLSSRNGFLQDSCTRN